MPTIKEAKRSDTLHRPHLESSTYNTIQATCISKRISSPSSNYELFSKAAPMYNTTIPNAGYTEKINYDSKINENKPSGNRKRNIEHIIKNHNTKITEGSTEKNVETSCNCRKKNICPLKEIVYSKTLYTWPQQKTETNTLSYVCMTGNDFKTRYSSKRYTNETELSKYPWKLNEK